MNEEISNIIRNIVENPNLTITSESRLIEDCGLSSFQTMLLLIKIESHFNLSMNYSNLAKIKTLKELVAEIKKTQSTISIEGDID